MINKVRLISTGGTIDSSVDYDPTKKSIFNGTNMPEILKQARLNYKIELESLMQKDSADINEADRKRILECCKNSEEKNIVITHGTDTLCETSQYLGKNKIEDTTIVLVGSFIPLSQKHSDAFFNLGYALGCVQLLPTGVYVAMGGEIFPWNKVYKNTARQIFERIR